MEGDQLAVERGVDIGLDVAVAGLHRPPELGHGVLQAVGRPAPVGEGDRARMVEVGVAYEGGHPGSMARSDGPVATTVLPDSEGRANTRRKSWASGPMERA